MAEINWDAPVGGSKEMLACIPGLTMVTLHQWQRRDHTVRRGSGQGRAIMWHASDVLEFAARYVVSRFGLLQSKFPFMWPVIRGAMLARQFPTPGDNRDRTHAFWLDAGGRLQSETLTEDNQETTAKSSWVSTHQKSCSCSALTLSSTGFPPASLRSRRVLSALVRSIVSLVLPNESRSATRPRLRAIHRRRAASRW